MTIYIRLSSEDYEPPELYVSTIRDTAVPIPAIQLTDRESADRIIMWLSPPKSVRVFDENDDLIELQIWTSSPHLNGKSTDNASPDVTIKPTYWAVMSPRDRVYSVHDTLFSDLFRRKDPLNEPSR